ncbi:MAG: UbiA family prenyltransferase [Vicinamibacterales bacterium]
MLNTARSTLRLLHYWWPLALGWSLTVVVGRATGRTPDPHGVTTLLAGIAAAYSLDRVIDPSDTPLPSWARLTLTATGLVMAAACVWQARQLPASTAVLMPALGIAALGYARLKQWPATKLVALPLVWTWASIALPFSDGSWFGWRGLLHPVAAPIFCLIAAGCLLCDLKDEDDDRRDGVRSLPAIAGGPATIRVAILLSLAAAILAIVEHRPGIVVGASALGVSTLSPRLLAAESTGPLLVDMILTLPGILVSARVF